MSLSLIRDYGSDSEEEKYNPNSMEIDEAADEGDQFNLILLDVVNSLLSNVERQFTQQSHLYTSDANYRCLLKDMSDSDDSDSSISEVWSFDSDDLEEDQNNGNPKLANKCLTKDELALEDLPPIEKLQISVDVKYLTQVGIVCSIVNQLVIIQSFKNIPVLDLETVIFCKEGTSIGQVFDVIGPVRQPNYVLRFNSQREILDAKLQLNSPVYYAEGQQQPITKYVFVHQLEKEKGTDASWKHNNEPPPSEIDYSDDEVERIEKWKKKAKSRKK